MNPLSVKTIHRSLKKRRRFDEVKKYFLKLIGPLLKGHANLARIFNLIETLSCAGVHKVALLFEATSVVDRPEAETWMFASVNGIRRIVLRWMPVMRYRDTGDIVNSPCFFAGFS